MHPRFCIIIDRPSRLSIDQQRRPHSETGPSHVWRDGSSRSYWHGIAIPAAWLENKGAIDPQLALTWPNIEQRRCLAEIVGWGRVLELLKPTVVDQDPDPELGTLLQVDLPDSPGERFLKVRCATGRDFVLAVPREMITALEANAWTFNIDPKILKQLEKRT
jgi:hypothetical protein